MLCLEIKKILPGYQVCFYICLMYIYCKFHYTEEELELLFQGAPSTELVRDQHSNGIDIVDLLTETRITTSKGLVSFATSWL